MFRFYIGTSRTGEVPREGPASPFSTALTLPSSVLPLIRSLRITLIVERESHYRMYPVQVADAVFEYQRIKGWIAALATISLGRAQNAPLRTLLIEFERGAEQEYPIDDDEDPEALDPPPHYIRALGEEQRVLDGLLVLRGVGEVTLLGKSTGTYREDFCDQVMQEPARRVRGRNR